MRERTDPSRRQRSPADRKSARRSTVSSRSSSTGCATAFFDCSIASEIGKGNRRELVIEAGK